MNDEAAQASMGPPPQVASLPALVRPKQADSRQRASWELDLSLESGQDTSLARTATSMVLWLLLLVASVTAMHFAYAWAERLGYERLDSIALHRLDLYAAGLESELRKHEYLPSLLELDAGILEVLTTPATTLRREKANKALAKLTVRAGAVAIFVLDSKGVGAASSNWYLPESFVGVDFSATPIYKEAMQSGQAGFFSASAHGEAPEYYFAQVIRHQGRKPGVAVAKISLEARESTWIESSSRSKSDRLLVLDENDVVIMSSVREWRYKVNGKVTPARRQQLLESKKYPSRKGSLEPLGLTARQTLEHGAVLLSLPPSDTYEPQSLRVAHERSMPRPGWRLVTLSDISDVQYNARNTAFGAGSLTAFVGLFGLYLLQRRRETANRLAAKEVLQRAHDELGLRVERRTAELKEANSELIREILERQRTEEVLREAQDELVQAGKMALLGQMSAGIAHEINQPLTALRALSDNTRQLIHRGRMDDVDKNLKSIAELTERMGRITAQLKTFSRKAPATQEPVSIYRAVNNALFLMSNRIRTDNVAVQLEIPGQLRALCDGNRLEQVLVNLFANAIDAMKGVTHERMIVVQAWAHGHRVLIKVADNGPGIPDNVMHRLFEPFFSTKPAGEGLGLGLVISAGIVREFGGILRALYSQSGAIFEFDLEHVSEEAGHV